MSVWTHVMGMIRVGRFNFNEGDLFTARTKEGMKILKDILGPMAVYKPESDPDCKVFGRNYDRCKLPKGSEGSLQYNIVSDPVIGSTDNYVISIWGDLRNYELSDVSDDLCTWFYSFQREVSNYKGDFEEDGFEIADAILNASISAGQRITFFRRED